MSNVFSQDCLNVDQTKNKKTWFVSSALGIQMSGVKPEDFISSNISHALVFNFGVWFTSEIALQVGYKGSYFNTISDNDKHHYNFLLGEVLLNLNEIFNNAEIDKTTWKIIFHVGAGYFYNIYYGRPNITGNIGLIGNLKLLSQVEVFVDVSSIVGWDIYQGDDDILPSCVIGISYNTNN